MNKKSFPSFKSAPKSSSGHEDEKKTGPNVTQSFRKDPIVRESTSKNKSQQTIPVSNDIFSRPLVFDYEAPNSKGAYAAGNLPNYENEFIRETAENRHASFARKLRKDPKNIGLWLEFVAFQDNIESFKKLSRRKQLERKISILERAIDLNPTELSLIELLLNISAEVDSFPCLLNKWNRQLDELESRDSALFWELAIKYIQFRTNHFSCFNREEVMSVFAEFFKKPSANSVRKVQLLGQLFSFLHKTGHFEVLVALLQIIVEVNLEICNNGSVDLEAYADCWDSGLYDHVGWYNQHPFHDFRPDPEASFFAKWASFELERSKLHIFPVQDDEVADLERSVLFHDISLFVVTFQQCEVKCGLLSILKLFFNTTRISNAFGLFESAEFIHFNEPSSFLQFGLALLKPLLPYFVDDWEFICTHMLLHHALFQDLDFIKRNLAANRESLVHFFAFGVFNLLIGDLQQARKVLLAVTERGFDKDELFDALSAVYQMSGNSAASSIISDFKSRPLHEFVNWMREGDFEKTESSNHLKTRTFKITAAFESGLDFKAEKDADCFRKEVYDRIQANVGDKELYTRVIEKCSGEYENLGNEVYRLMMEQQLRVRCLLEEIK